MLNQTTLSQDERVNAALAHVSIVLGIFSRGLLGIVLAVLIWITQRGKSRFAARQAAQAVVYQLFGLLLAIAAWLVWALVFFGAIFVPVAIDARNPEPLLPYTMIPAFALILVPLTLMIAWTVYGIYAAVQVWQGKDFSYPVIGQWIA